MAYNLRTNEILLHGKFQPPNFNGVAVHRSQTEVQTKRGLSNICLDVYFTFSSIAKQIKTTSATQISILLAAL